MKLIPWDPDSESQIDRLFDQRVQCGWGADKVRQSWTKWQREGLRSLFWLVPEEEDDIAFAQKIAKYSANHPEHEELLEDTCTSIRLVPRQPTNEKFRPLGHIALDTESAHGKDAKEEFEEDGLLWIGPLFVVPELQGSGLGRAAMDMIEGIAMDSPLNAHSLGLDCLAEKHQKDPAFLSAFYKEPPVTTNQGWYERRGFQVFKTVENLYYGIPDKHGKLWEMTTVFMKKRLGEK